MPGYAFAEQSKNTKLFKIYCLMFCGADFLGKKLYTSV